MTELIKSHARRVVRMMPAKENTVVKKNFVASECFPSIRRRTGW